MNIKEVNSKKAEKVFFECARKIYSDDKNWICPPDIAINSKFHIKTNTKLIKGKSKRWVLYNSDSIVGRIAAFIDPDYFTKYEQATGGIGFFECENNQEAANVLFTTAIDWLKSEGMEAADGPINFGSNEAYWGLLIEGFTPPSYEMPYHKPYYRNLFENFGWKIYYHQYSYHLKTVGQFPERFWKVAEWMQKKQEYHVEYFDYSKTDKFVKDFVEIYNQAWPSFKKDIIPINESDVRKMLGEAKQILISEFVLFAYHGKRPVGFYINIPDVNQILKIYKGKFGLLQKLHFLYLSKFTKTITRMRGIIYGFIPEYQNKGIDSLIFLKLKEAVEKHPQYSEIELSWVGDFNPKMLQMYKKFNAEKAKEYITMRYLFDRDKEFNRYPIPE